MSVDEAPAGFAALRLDRLKRLQALRAERDALVAQDPGGARQSLIEQYPTPLDFAERFDMRTRRTPALELLSRNLRTTVDTKDGRLVVSIPPQEGKTTLIRWLITWLLVQDPDRRIVFASFAQSLARQTGREVRNKLHSFPELALPLDQSHRDATDWAIAGKSGGLYSVGVGGALTGRPADAMIIDDPLRGQADADSDITRANLHEWWESVARTRLAPGALALVIQTRWHEDDLAGRLIGEGWPLINIPALADGRTEDALDREPGEWLISARGRTATDWENTRRDVGERTFAALYQGRPAPLEGGIFQREWFNTHRLSARPELDPVAIGVDPADTGKGDAAGILVAGVTPGGQIVFVADESGQLSQAAWARRACLAWIRHGAARIVQEHNLGMRTSIPDAWALLYRQATALAAVQEAREGSGRAQQAQNALEAAGDFQAAKFKDLWEVASDDLYLAVLEHGESGPRVVSITPRQSKRVRAESVAGAFETGRAVILGELKALEHEACFPAGTAVRTVRGQIPIEQVTTDDEVLTRNGWRAVEWSGQTGVQNLLELRTSDGHALQATPNHRVWVEGQGWTRLEFVVPGCRMKTCLGPAPVSTSPSKAGTTRWTRTATGRPLRLVASSSDSSTETSGSQRTADRSLTAGTSTTRTRTSPTTTPATSARCRLESMLDSTALTAAGASGLPSNVLSSASRTGLDESPLLVSAATAAVSTSRPVSGPRTAVSTVERPTTPTGAASRPRLDIPLSSDGPSTTVLSVEPVSGPPVPVYDLTVAEDHEFFAGGLLVHNCTWQEGQKSPNRIDTLAMLTMHLESVRGTARISRVSTGDGGAVIPINTARGRGAASGRGGVTPMSMRRALRGVPQSPHERDA